MGSYRGIRRPRTVGFETVMAGWPRRTRRWRWRPASTMCSIARGHERAAMRDRCRRTRRRTARCRRRNCGSEMRAQSASQRQFVDYDGRRDYWEVRSETAWVVAEPTGASTRILCGGRCFPDRSPTFVAAGRDVVVAAALGCADGFLALPRETASLTPARGG